MKKNILIITRFALLFCVVLAFASCVKHDDFYSEKVGGEPNRKTVVQVTGADDVIQFARDAKATADTFALIDLRRYPNDQNGLNQPLTVKLTADASLIDAYNTANGTSLAEMPAGSYTFLDDINNITFQPGEAIKEVRIIVDQSKLDLSQVNALAFTISDLGSGAVASPSLKNAIYTIGIKNLYEADYTTSGFFFHPSSPRALSDSKHLATLSATKCLAPLADLYGNGYYFSFDVSPTNTLINWDATPVAPPTSGFYPSDNPGGVAYPGPEYPGTAPYVQTTYNNTYEPDTKTFYMHYGYGGGSTGPTGWTRNVYEKWVRQ